MPPGVASPTLLALKGESLSLTANEELRGKGVKAMPKQCQAMPSYEGFALWSLLNEMISNDMII